MASFRKIKGGYRAEVARRGIRRSECFETKAAATAWAAKVEAEILGGRYVETVEYTLQDAIDKYLASVSVKKRGHNFEKLRFKALERDFPALCKKKIAEIASSDIANWRDERLKTVSADTVAREATLIRHIWAVARKEWGWVKESPWPNVKMPKTSKARDRRTSPQELRSLLRRLGYVTGKAPTTFMEEVAWCWLLSHHTAMRAGEVRDLTRDRVNLATRVVRLDNHKTVERQGKRFVPITAKAARIMKVLDDAARAADRKAYFLISPASLDTLFRKAKKQLMIKNLHFHDARADAITRLSKRYDVMRLSAMSGHKDINLLREVYYRETPEMIAATL